MSKEPLLPEVPPTQKEAERGLVTKGQRAINIIWERTQAFIAATVVTTVLFVSANVVLRPEDQMGSKMAAFVFLTSASNLVIGFYFGRTNHQRMGGVGSVTEGETR